MDGKEVIDQPVREEPRVSAALGGAVPSFFEIFLFLPVRFHPALIIQNIGKIILPCLLVFDPSDKVRDVPDDRLKALVDFAFIFLRFSISFSVNFVNFIIFSIFIFSLSISTAMLYFSSIFPSFIPSIFPSFIPSIFPSFIPSFIPSIFPSFISSAFVVVLYLIINLCFLIVYW